MKGFNPSGSMDYFGSGLDYISVANFVVFQSFWFNGLLWKIFSIVKTLSQFTVSILLVQWITLEVELHDCG